MSINTRRKWLIIFGLVALIVVTLLVLHTIQTSDMKTTKTSIMDQAKDFKPVAITANEEVNEKVDEQKQIEKEKEEAELQAQQEQEAYEEEYVEEYVEEEVYEEEYYEEETYDDYVESSGYVSASDFMVQGVVYANGVKYTWYSERVLPGGGLSIPGRHANGDGYICDEDGYICVASCDYSYGTVLDTPFGAAKVYDVCPTSGIVDVYVNW